MITDKIEHVIEMGEIVRQYGMDAGNDILFKMLVVQRELILYKELANILNVPVTVQNAETIMLQYNKEITHKEVAGSSDGYFFNDTPLVIFHELSNCYIDDNKNYHLIIEFESNVLHDAMSFEDMDQMMAVLSTASPVQ